MDLVEEADCEKEVSLGVEASFGGVEGLLEIINFDTKL